MYDNDFFLLSFCSYCGKKLTDKKRITYQEHNDKYAFCSEKHLDYFLDGNPNYDNNWHCFRLTNNNVLMIKGNSNIKKRTINRKKYIIYNYNKYKVRTFKEVPISKL